MRDNRLRGPGIKSVVPALFHFENAAREHPGEQDLCLCQRPSTAAGCPRGRRTRETDPSDIRNIMKFTWLLTAVTATLSCMATGATAAAATDAAAEAAALAIAKKLYPTCAVSAANPIAALPLFRPRANPLLAPRCSFADLPLRPVLSSCASQSWSQHLAAVSQTPRASAPTCRSIPPSQYACCKDAVRRMPSVSCFFEGNFQIIPPNAPGANMLDDQYGTLNKLPFSRC